MEKRYKDTDLREALKRKYADTPKLPADFMAKSDRKGMSVRRWMAVAASLLLLIGIGFTLIPQEEQQNDNQLTALQTHETTTADKVITTTANEVITTTKTTETTKAERPKLSKLSKFLDGPSGKAERSSTKPSGKAEQPKLSKLSKFLDEPSGKAERSSTEPSGKAEQPSIDQQLSSIDQQLASVDNPQQASETLTDSDIPITRPENYKYTPEEIALMKRQAAEAYLKWVELELEIAKYNQEQTAQK